MPAARNPKEKKPLQPNPFRVRRVPGFAEFAAKQTGTRLGRKPLFKGEPIKGFRVRETRAQRARIVAERIVGIRDRGASSSLGFLGVGM